MTPNETEAMRFIEEHVARVEPLAREANLASWEAATTGQPDAIARSADARTAVKKVYSERVSFERVRSFLEVLDISDPIVRRQLVVLDHAFTANQLPAETLEEFAAREAELEEIFYNFRAELEGRKMSNNELRDLLRGEESSDRRKEIWQASKALGSEIAPRLIDFVRRRNEAARALGFADHYTMALHLQEIPEGELFELLHDFRKRTDESFVRLREHIDATLSARFGVARKDLRPWHWDDFFAQEAPAVGSLDLDPLFASFDHEEFARAYFQRIGLPVDDVLDRSDLYEREGKDQHAFCLDVDREGDVRILCNLRREERWMRTLLHELGHAVYDKFLPRSLPYLLRAPSHTLTTESIAMYFGRLTREPEWLQRELPDHPTVDAAEVDEQQRASMIIAARWMLVMVHFERELYRDPDRPDLNTLWWDIVEEYQLVRRPDDRNRPDWAAKIHLSLAPVYYHNYLLGELMASQLTGAISRQPGDVGEYLRERIFGPGATLPWNDHLREATGAPLSVDHFVAQYVD